MTMSASRRPTAPKLSSIAAEARRLSNPKPSTRRCTRSRGAYLGVKPRKQRALGANVFCASCPSSLALIFGHHRHHDHIHQRRCVGQMPAIWNIWASLVPSNNRHQIPICLWLPKNFCATIGIIKNHPNLSVACSALLTGAWLRVAVGVERECADFKLGMS